jgi:ParB family chromosome partitioning protein
VELIFGSRRLFVARHLNIPLAVELRDCSDLEGIIAMDVENRLRRDISPYERGHCYLRWLREGHFKSQEEIARALKISTAKVSRLVRIAQLPSVLVSAFEKTADIRENWGQSLASAWHDSHRQAVIAKRARAMASRTQRPPAEHIFKELIAPVHSPQLRSQHRDEVVKDEQGRPLFRVKQQRYSVSFVLPVTSITDHTMHVVLHAIRRALRDEISQSNDSAEKAAPSGSSGRTSTIHYSSSQ